MTKEYPADIDIEYFDYKHKEARKKTGEEESAKDFDISTEEYDRTSAKVEILEYEIKD